MSWDVILFDLDGTLTDPKEGITKSVAHSLKFFGIEVEDLDSLKKFIGPPLIDSYMRYYGFSREQAVLAVEYYREYYAVTGIFENRVYDGVETMLQTLKDLGKVCVLATSKPEHYAVQILEHFGLSRYFSCVAGATMDEKRTNKADVIAYALERVGNIGKTVMVGDRHHDVEGAKAHGLPCIGVLYGYGSREELETAGADYLAETAEEILKFV